MGGKRGRPLPPEGAARDGGEVVAADGEIAQVALGFGASELCGPIANKRGLEIAEDATRRVKRRGDVALRALKRAEIAGLVERCRRTPVFADAITTATDTSMEARDV